MHGGLGIVKYYCDDAEFVNRALEALEQTAEKGDRIYKWKSWGSVLREPLLYVLLSVHLMRL